MQEFGINIWFSIDMHWFYIYQELSNFPFGNCFTYNLRQVSYTQLLSSRSSGRCLLRLAAELSMFNLPQKDDIYSAGAPFLAFFKYQIFSFSKCQICWLLYLFISKRINDFICLARILFWCLSFYIKRILSICMSTLSWTARCRWQIWY